MSYRRNGFTLVELMVTLAIVGVVMAIAIPSFSSQIRNNKSVILTTDFADMIGLARTEAVVRRTRVSLCPSDDGENCTGIWNEGYIVFEDTADTDTADEPVVGRIIKYWQPPAGEIEFDVLFGAAAADFFRFTSMGTLAAISQEPLTAEIKLTGCTGKHARNISINTSGQVSVQPEDC